MAKVVQRHIIVCLDISSTATGCAMYDLKTKQVKTYEFAAKGDLRSFLWYFCATVEFNIDPATKKALPSTRKEIRVKLLKLAGMFGQCVALYTLLVPFDYNLFPRKTITSVSDIFFWGNLMNNYIMGAMTKTTVEFGTSIFALAVSLFSGLSTCDVNVRPLTMTSR